MIYYFSYLLNGATRAKTCITIREAEVFFDVLISAGAEYIRVNTVKKRCCNDKN